jgi:hypothetical protein
MAYITELVETKIEILAPSFRLKTEYVNRQPTKDPHSVKTAATPMEEGARLVKSDQPVAHDLELKER